MILPFRDDDRDLFRPAVVTWWLLGLNVLAFLWQQVDPSVGERWGAVPYELTRGVDLNGFYAVGGGILRLGESPSPVWWTMISSMFLHGSWGHLGGNLLYLWIFGDNVEHRFGAVRFLVFYLVSGLVAVMAHVMMVPGSVVPMVGASGAISGVLGAYLVLFPKNRIDVIVFLTVVSLPAVVVIGVWGMIQVFSGWSEMGRAGSGGGVAYAAHVGGLLAGVVMGLLVRWGMKEEPRSPFQEFRGRWH